MFQQKKMYNFNNEKRKKSVEKKIDSLFRRIKNSQQTGLRGQRYTFFSHESQSVDIKNDLEI